MVEEKRSLLAGMISNVKFIEKEDKSLQKKEKIEKLVKSREWKFKGFYIMPKNEV
jgi:hypothetical protein